MTPLAARAHDIQDRVDDRAAVDLRSAKFVGSRQQGANNLPLFIRQIARIIHAHRYGSVFLDVRYQEGGVVTLFNESCNLKTRS